MIKRISTLLFLLMLAITPGIFAQTAVGVYVSPDINRVTSPLAGRKPVNNFGVTLGLSFQTSLSERFSLLYGIQYAPKKTTFNFNGNYPSLTLDQQGTITEVTSIKSRQQFVEVPLQFRYTLLGRGARLTPYVQAGVVGNWVTSIKNEYGNDSGDRIQTQPEISGSRFNLSPEIGIGVAYRINEQLGLNVQPTLRTEFDSPISISRLGLGTTLFFKF